MTSTTLAFPDDESPFDKIRQADEHGNHYWPGRTLQPLMGYDKWDSFLRVIKRAISAAKNTGTYSDQSFSPIREVVPQGGPARVDYRFSREAAYLVAMNGDPNKPEVAAAQAYFVAKTREAELARPASTALDMAIRVITLQDRVMALTTSNASLAQRVADLEPKAEGYDDLISADGLFTLNAAAKSLALVTGKLGERRFVNLLRGMKIIIQDSKLPYQDVIDRGYFTLRTDVSSGKATPVAMVTPKGLRWLHNELRDEHTMPIRIADNPNVVQLPQQSRGEIA